MITRALPAAYQVPALGTPSAYSTGNLRADCARWCRDHRAPRIIHHLGPRRTTAPSRNSNCYGKCRAEQLVPRLPTFVLNADRGTVGIHEWPRACTCDAASRDANSAAPAVLSCAICIRLTGGYVLYRWASSRCRRASATKWDVWSCSSTANAARFSRAVALASCARRACSLQGRQVTRSGMCEVAARGRRCPQPVLIDVGMETARPVAWVSRDRSWAALTTLSSAWTWGSAGTSVMAQA